MNRSNDRYQDSNRHGSVGPGPGQYYKGDEEGRGLGNDVRDHFSFGTDSADLNDRRNFQGGDFINTQQDRNSGGSLWNSNLGREKEIGRFSGVGPKNYRRSDERIKEDVCDSLAHHADIDASEIHVDVRDCIVTLSGTVDERRTKRLAEDCAESVRGVLDVKNEIQIEGGLFAGWGAKSSEQGKGKTKNSPLA